MSIYATIASLDPDDHPDGPGRPYHYQGSHLLPHDDDERAGDIQLAEIPSHITRDERDDQPEDMHPWPWLRLSVDTQDSAADVILDVAQARYLAGQLTAWADDADPPEFGGGHHYWIHARYPDGGGHCGPGSSDRTAVLARLAELRAEHPDTVYRLVRETSTSLVEET